MMTGQFKLKIFFIIGVAVLVSGLGYLLWPRPTWSDEELAQLRGLWLGSLPALPADPSNRYGADPEAAAFGQKLFFDTRFSSNGKVACATCHKPELDFQDGTPLAHGVGVTNRRTMPLIGAAYSPWLFWDGRKDSLWAQALGPLENPVEHGGNRTQYAHLIAQYYADEYEALFGPLPDLSGLPAQAGPGADPQARAAWEAMTPEEQESVTRIFANMGKAIAAYEARLLPGSSRFDRYVEAALKNDTEAMESLLTAEEVAGLRLFVGEANCTQCHNGPLFTDNHFHNTGVPAAPGLPEDVGRALGAPQVMADEFNCLSQYSDAGPEDCAELRYMITEGHDLVRQFKPPSLRNVNERPPYMHAGQFATLEEVLNHYNTAPEAPAGHSELQPLGLSETELNQLIAFLRTLSGPAEAEPQWLQSPVAANAP
jgi:cytochrome c peroxidase